MAKKRPSVVKLKKKWKYFFIDKKLYKLVRVIYARDEAVALCLEDDTLRMFAWSDVRRHASRGFTIGQVAKIINRTPRQIHNYLMAGEVESDGMLYSRVDGRPVRRIFSEENIFQIQEVMANKHFGRPRNDGLIKPKNVLGKSDIRAAVKHDMQLYAKTEDGEYVPVYLAEDW